MNERIIKFRGKVGISWWHVTPESDDWEQFWYIVDKKTVGQFTGLTDKHGKEIYEDDTLVHRFPAGEQCYVVKIGLDGHNCDGLDFAYHGVHFVEIDGYRRSTGTSTSYPQADEMEIVKPKE